jgi:hypothetical protein
LVYRGSIVKETLEGRDPHARKRKHKNNGGFSQIAFDLAPEAA